MAIGTYRYLISKSLNGITLHEVQNKKDFDKRLKIYPRNYHQQIEITHTLCCTCLRSIDTSQ
jgi:hypothetical protein